MMSLIILLVVLIPLMAILLDSQVGRALASRLERRSLDGPPDLMAERVAFLEGEVEGLSSDITRLNEESQFVHKLLTERRPAPRAAALGGAGIFLSRIFGFVRDRVFAHWFGTSDFADAWRAALRLPNVLQ